MKKITFALFLIFTGHMLCHAQNYAGSWKGTLSFPGGSLKIVYHVAEDGDRYKATMDSPDQMVMGLPVRRVYAKADSITFDMKEIGMEFKGVLSGKDKISGKFYQNGAAFPLELSRNGGSAYDRPQTPAKPYPYQEREIRVKGKDEIVSLAGTLTFPSGDKAKRYPTVILITGSGPQDRNEEIFGHKPFLVIADSLTRAGYAVYRYDDRGTGQSSGKYASATIEDFAADAEAVFDYIKTLPKVDNKEVFLMGHSEGALIAAMVAAKNKDIAGVISMSGPVVSIKKLLLEQTSKISSLMGVSEDKIAHTSKLNMALYDLISDKTLPSDSLYPKIVRISSTYLGDELKFLPDDRQKELYRKIEAEINSPWIRSIIDLDPATYFAQLRCPVIGLYGSKDAQVLPGNAQKLQEVCPHARVRVFDGLNHLLQPADKGLPQEYVSIPITISSDALRWLVQQLKAITPPEKK